MAWFKYRRPGVDAHRNFQGHGGKVGERMLRRTGVSVRMNLLSMIVVMAIAGLIVVTYTEIGRQNAAERRLVSMTATGAAAQAVQYDIADLSGLQKAYVLDIRTRGVSAAADGSAPRRDYLAAATRTSADLKVLESRVAAESAADKTAFRALSAGLAGFIQVDDQAIAL